MGPTVNTFKTPVDPGQGSYPGASEPHCDALPRPSAPTQVQMVSAERMQEYAALPAERYAAMPPGGGEAVDWAAWPSAGRLTLRDVSVTYESPDGTAARPLVILQPPLVIKHPPL